MNRYKLLQDEKTRLVAEAEAIVARATAENRLDLTAEEKTRDDEIYARLGDLNREIKREDRRREHALTAPTLSDDRPTLTGVHDLSGDEPWGFATYHMTEDQFVLRHPHAHLPAHDTRHPARVYRLAGLGEFLSAVAVAGTPGGRVDRRLYQAGASGISGAGSGVPSDGGFLVRKDYTADMLDRAVENAVLAPLCDQIEIGEGSDSLEAPMIDETSRANGSRWGGVRVYRRAEGDSVTATKPKFGKWELRLEDLMGLAYATDRLIRDATALGQIFARAFESEFAFKLDDEIIRGTGAGECLGILNSPALVSVSKETNQAAATIVAENIMKMRMRLWARSRRNSVWLINQDTETQLHSMTLAVGTGGVPVYMPAAGLSVDGFDRLYGRPVIPIEQCETLGTVGDILLVDLSQYALIRKGIIEAAESMHVLFIYNERTFRWVYRVNGAPKWSSVLTPYKGTGNTVAPFVALATRS